MPPRPLVTVVIPVRNEEFALPMALKSLARQSAIGRCELLVVDGGSADRTVAVAESFPFARVVHSPRGRAAQMNAGARAASAPVLWFLHADSTLPDSRTLEALAAAAAFEAAPAAPAPVAGCFRFHLRGDSLYFKLVTAFVNFRARRLGRPYGDQGLWTRADVFAGIGGFREDLPACEDIDLALRLRRAGPFRLMPQTVETSARTWKRHGKLATTAFHLKQWAGFEWSRMWPPRRDRRRVPASSATPAPRDAATPAPALEGPRQTPPPA